MIKIMCEKSENQIVRNKIKEILRIRGFKDLRPTKEVLEMIGISMTRFNQLMENEYELTLTELLGFSKWLKLDFEEIYINPLKPLKDESKMEFDFDNKNEVA